MSNDIAPDLPPTPLPQTRGRDAKEYLEAHGIVPVRPPLRSSQYEMAVSNPFLYYLVYRLGLTPALSYSAALSRGSWTHEYFFVLDAEQESVDAYIEDRLRLRFDELKETGRKIGISREALTPVLEREENDCRVAGAWFRALREIPIRIDGQTQTFPDYLLSPHRTIISQELQLTTRIPGINIPVTAQPDLVYLDENTNTLWIVDFKTCAELPCDRLLTCPEEFQTLHYFYVMKAALDDGSLAQQFPSINAQTTLGGVQHLAIHKPPIKFGTKDRDFRLDTSPFKSGPRRGQPRNEKKYHGEPRIENYVTRCLEYLKGQNEYEHLQPQWTSNPPVALSTTTNRHLLDEDVYADYITRASYVADLARRPAYPCNFLPSISGLRNFGRLSIYAPFFLVREVWKWPDIINQEGFIIHHRDEPE